MSDLPVDANKIEQGRVALRKAIMKVAQHYKLNPMELVYAHHEAINSIGDYSDRAWMAFVAESFLEVLSRHDTIKLATH